MPTKDRIIECLVFGSPGGPSQDVSVRVVRGEPNDHGPTYNAFVEDTPVGVIKKEYVTFERRTPGRRIVNSRWQSLRWRARTPFAWNISDHRFHYQTIGEAAQQLARHYVLYKKMQA